MNEVEIEALSRRLPSAHAVRAAATLDRQIKALGKQFGCKPVIIGMPAITDAHCAALADAAARFETHFGSIA